MRRNNLGVFNPKVVLFDMDGTLCDSMPNHGVAWVAAMRAAGIAFTVNDSYLTEGARGVNTIQRYVLAQQNRHISEADAAKIYAHKAEIFATLPPAPIFPGTFELMERIKRCGMRIGIVTGSAQRPLIAGIVDTFRDYLTADDIVSAYDVKRGKPDPEPFLIGMAKCGGVLPTETIVVENAPLGVRAGSASGAFTIAVNTGPLDDSVLWDAGAHVLYHSIAALRDAWAIAACQ